MFGKSVTLFTLFGFAVRVDVSWLVIAALLTWSLVFGFFPMIYPGLTPATYWWMGIAGTLGLFASIVLHEMSHSLVARRYNLPVKGITLFIFGGVAEMGEEPRSPKAEFLMAIAGPIASIVIGVVFYVIGASADGRWPVPVIGVMAYLGWLNWILAAFNLIPAFPLDGGRVLRSALWHFMNDIRRATRIAAAIGSGFGVLLMAYGIYRLLTGGLIQAVWYFLIGMFIRSASQMSYRQVLLRSVLSGEPVRHFMRPDPVRVPSGASIQELVDNYIYRYHFKMFPVVTNNDELSGCVNIRDVTGISRDEWGSHAVGEVAQPCSEGNTVTPDTDALKVLAKMRDTGAGRLIVADQGRLVGIVSVTYLFNFLASKLELEGGGGLDGRNLLNSPG